MSRISSRIPSLSRREIRQAGLPLGAARGRLPDAQMRQAIARYFDAIVDG